MRTKIENPESETLEAWWALANLVFNGYEGEGSSGDEGGAGDGGTGSTTDEGEGDSGGADGDDGDDDSDLPDDKDVDGLKSALKKERNSAKTNARSVRALEKKLRDAEKLLEAAADKDKTELEKANKKVQRELEKTTKLAGRLRTQAIDGLIERYAREAKFIDVDDALTGVDRAGIQVEQDEDDPSDITVDAKTVKAAVKALADKKKHLIGDDSGAGDGTPSGSRFNGGQKDKAKASEDKLKELYPSLR